MAKLFGKSKSTISEHIKNIFSEGELDEKVAVRKFRITTHHGAIANKIQEIDVKGYNLKARCQARPKLHEKNSRTSIFGKKTLSKILIAI